MNEKLSRRRLLSGAAALVGTAFLGRGTALAESQEQPQQPNQARPNGQTPNLESAPYITLGRNQRG